MSSANKNIRREDELFDYDEDEQSMGSQQSRNNIGPSSLDHDLGVPAPMNFQTPPIAENKALIDTGDDVNMNEGGSNPSILSRSTPIYSRSADKMETSGNKSPLNSNNTPQVHFDLPPSDQYDSNQPQDNSNNNDPIPDWATDQNNYSQGQMPPTLQPPYTSMDQKSPQSRDPKELFTPCDFGSDQQNGKESSYPKHPDPIKRNQSSLQQLKMHGILKHSKTEGGDTTEGSYIKAPMERGRSVIEAALLPNFTDEQTQILNDAVSRSDFDEDEVFLQLENEGVVTLPNLIPKYPLEDLVPFVTRLACVFHSFGAPANRTEWHMTEVCESLGVVATFSVLPTVVTITFGIPEGMDAISRSIRIDQNIVECGRLNLVDRLIACIIRQQVTLYEARDELERIVDQPPYYSPFIRILASCLCSASAAIVCFNSAWPEVLISMILGIVVGLFGWISALSTTFARVSDILAALLVSAIALPITAYYENICFSGIVLSSLVWRLPGLPLTLAVRELATGNFVAGTVRIFTAFLGALKLGFGIAIGSSLPFWVSHSNISEACAVTISAWWKIPFFFIIVSCFNVLLDSRFQEWPGQMAASAVGYTIIFVGTNYFHSRQDVNMVIAAFGVGLTGNVYSKITRNPGVIFIFSGILLLVPGGVAVMGGSAFFDDSSWSGLEFGLTMVVVGFSITVGTLIADLLVFPRNRDHYLF